MAIRDSDPHREAVEAEIGKVVAWLRKDVGFSCDCVLFPLPRTGG